MCGSMKQWKGAPTWLGARYSCSISRWNCPNAATRLRLVCSMSTQHPTGSRTDWLGSRSQAAEVRSCNDNQQRAAGASSRCSWLFDSCHVRLSLSSHQSFLTSCSAIALTTCIPPHSGAHCPPAADAPSPSQQLDTQAGHPTPPDSCNKVQRQAEEGNQQTHHQDALPSEPNNCNANIHQQ